MNTMNIVKTLITRGGSEYTFEGKYALPQAGDYYLHLSGEIKLCTFSFTGGDGWPIVKLVPKAITAGDITFEIGDTMRCIKPNEWYMGHAGVSHWNGSTPTAFIYSPLKFIGVVGKRKEETNE